MKSASWTRNLNVKYLVQLSLVTRYNSHLQDTVGEAVSLFGAVCPLVVFGRLVKANRIMKAGKYCQIIIPIKYLLKSL